MISERPFYFSFLSFGFPPKAQVHPVSSKKCHRQARALPCPARPPRPLVPPVGQAVARRRPCRAPVLAGPRAPPLRCPWLFSPPLPHQAEARPRDRLPRALPEAPRPLPAPAPLYGPALASAPSPARPRRGSRVTNGSKPDPPLRRG